MFAERPSGAPLKNGLHEYRIYKHLNKFYFPLKHILLNTFRARIVSEVRTIEAIF